MILFLEDGQHGLPACGGPASKHHGHFVLVDQLLCPTGKGRPIRSPVLFNRDDGQALALDIEPACGVDLIDREQLGLGHGVLGDGHGAGPRVKNAYLDETVEFLGDRPFAPAPQ